MSRYVVGSIVFDDLDLLCETLAGLFGAVDRASDGSNKLVAFGYRGDSREKEIGQVAAVVRRGHVGGAANDLPVRREADGTYRLIVSEYDRRGIPERFGWTDGNVEGHIAQQYGPRKVKKALAPQGYTFREEISPDGQIRLTAALGKPGGRPSGGYSL